MKKTLIPIIRLALIVSLLMLEMILEQRIQTTGITYELMPFSLYKALSSLGFILVSFIAAIDTNIAITKPFIKKKRLFFALILCLIVTLPQHYVLTYFFRNITFQWYILLQSTYLNHGLCVVAGCLLARTIQVQVDELM